MSLSDEDVRAVSSVLDRLREARLSHAERCPGRPFVLLTWAQSADGYIAAKESTRTPISCHATSELTQGIRAASDAVLVGVGTALADNPRLTVRSSMWKGLLTKQPAAVILDSSLRTSSEVACISERSSGGNSCTYIYVTDGHEKLLEDSPWCAAVASGCTRIKGVPVKKSHGAVGRPGTPAPGLDLVTVLRSLGEEGVVSVMVEGGCRVLTSFVEQGLGDFAIVTIAPRFLGHGVRSLSSSESASSQQLFSNMEGSVWTPVGEDMVLAGALVTRPPLNSS